MARRQLTHEEIIANNYAANRALQAFVESRGYDWHFSDDGWPHHYRLTRISDGLVFRFGANFMDEAQDSILRFILYPEKFGGK